MERLLRIKEEVHAPNGVEHGPRPDGDPASYQRGGPLPGQLVNHLPAELSIFSVQVLGAETVRQRGDLLGPLAGG
jgi:hypothetical protein